MRTTTARTRTTLAASRRGLLCSTTGPTLKISPNRFYSNSSSKPSLQNENKKFSKQAMEELYQELKDEFGEGNIGLLQDEEPVKSVTDYASWNKVKDATKMELQEQMFYDEKLKDELKQFYLKRIQELDEGKRLAIEGDLDSKSLLDIIENKSVDPKEQELISSDKIEKAHLTTSVVRNRFIHERVAAIENRFKPQKVNQIEEWMTSDSHNLNSLDFQETIARLKKEVDRATEAFLFQENPHFAEDKKFVTAMFEVGREPPGRVEFLKKRFINKAKWRLWARKLLSSARIQQRMKSFYPGEAWQPDQELEIFHHGIPDLPNYGINNRVVQIENEYAKVKAATSGRYKKLKRAVQKNIATDEFAKRGIRTYRDYFNYRQAQEYSLYNHHWSMKNNTNTNNNSKASLSFSTQEEEDIKKRAMANLQQRKTKLTQNA